MLERLMERNYLYKKDEDGKYDDNFLTKLVQNYRSHEAIIQLPNEMFYENELIACAGEDANSAENWPYLPRKKFPIIFHAIYGYEERDSSHRFHFISSFTFLNFRFLCYNMKLINMNNSRFSAFQI